MPEFKSSDKRNLFRQKRSPFWWAECQHQGQRYFKNLHTTSLDEARARRDAWLRELRGEGTRIETGPVRGTFAEAARITVEEITRQNEVGDEEAYALSTIVAHKRNIGRLALYLGPLRVADLAVSDIEGLVTKLREERTMQGPTKGQRRSPKDVTNMLDSLGVVLGSHPA